MSTYPQFEGGPLEANKEFHMPPVEGPFGYSGAGIVGVYRPTGPGKYKWDPDGQFLKENGDMLPIFQAA